MSMDRNINWNTIWADFFVLLLIIMMSVAAIAQRIDNLQESARENAWLVLISERQDLIWDYEECMMTYASREDVQVHVCMEQRKERLNQLVL